MAANHKRGIIDWLIVALLHAGNMDFFIEIAINNTVGVQCTHITSIEGKWFIENVHMKKKSNLNDHSARKLYEHMRKKWIFF